MVIPKPRNSVIYRIVFVILLAISIFILIKIAPTLTRPENIPSDDFVRFWASGRLNLNGLDPYDPQAIERLQVEAGDLTTGQSSITLNPPWVIALLMPFGIAGYPASRLIWLILSIALILLSTLMLWRVYSADTKQRWLAVLAAFIFAPTLSVLEKGQISGLILLGISGFLYFTVIYPKSWLAGVFLALVSVKPQMIIIFWIAILFWIIKERRWMVMVSALITVLVLTLITMIFNPHIIQQYLGMLQNYRISDWAVPTIGSYLRFYWLGLDHFWLQFIPVILGVIWFLFYWRLHRASWNWVDEMPLILLVSLVTSPYLWTYDVVVLIPAILLSIFNIARNKIHWLSVVLILVFLAINVSDLVLHMRLDDFWFVWLVPAFFIWYLVVRWIYPYNQKLPYATPV